MAQGNVFGYGEDNRWNTPSCAGLPTCLACKPPRTEVPVMLSVTWSKAENGSQTRWCQQNFKIWHLHSTLKILNKIIKCHIIQVANFVNWIHHRTKRKSASRSEDKWIMIIVLRCHKVSDGTCPFVAIKILKTQLVTTHRLLACQ